MERYLSFFYDMDYVRSGLDLLNIKRRFKNRLNPIRAK